ncbi:hypothetical protein CRE_08506 [Caenorhabditis remanei]|uniref:Uncharacterized protein n=1 Tax=Caenorhabditis remanei TaxID=31234 RepID=E3N6U7_CAERE|nr:hypothetical protein CRE_08506 [Caenorhabditis remanei]
MGSYRRVDSFEDIHFSDSSPSSESSPERSPSPSSSPPDSPPSGASSAEDDDGIYVRDEDRNKKVVYQEKNSEDETDQEDESEAEQEDEVSLGQAGIDTENIIRNNTYLIRLKLDQQLKIKQLNHPWLLHDMSTTTP